MPPNHRDLLAELLRACFDAAPDPLYPAAFAQEKGIDRAAVDQALDDLRLRGLVRLTEWVQGQGQGYTLTQAGLDLLEDPRGLRPGMPLPAVRRPAPEPDIDAEPRPAVPLFRRGPPVGCWALLAINVLIYFASESQDAAAALGPFAHGRGQLTAAAGLRPPPRR